MENKVYMSQQLICMLPPLAVKVMGYLLNWQKYDSIKYYENQMTKWMHISKEELELAIQTLIDNNLIDVSRVDQTWMISINKETVKKYFNVDMKTVHDHEGLQLARRITWNKEEESSQKKSATSIDDMSEKDLKTLLLRIQASLNEKEQVKKVVKTAEVEDDGLPW